MSGVSRTEHDARVGPVFAGLLEAEGVGDPDRVLQQLVDEFRPADGDAASSSLAPSPTETPSHA
jgi:hypothetical protein